MALSHTNKSSNFSRNFLKNITNIVNNNGRIIRNQNSIFFYAGKVTQFSCLNTCCYSNRKVTKKVTCNNWENSGKRTLHSIAVMGIATEQATSNPVKIVKKDQATTSSSNTKEAAKMAAAKEAEAKKHELSVAFKKDTDFADWYPDVIKKYIFFVVFSFFHFLLWSIF